jgi:hypothetical protein
MPRDDQFGLFMDNGEGPIWKAFFTDLEAARNHAQKSADEERCEFFVYSFENFSEVARLFPTRLIPKT